ncbi:MAG: DNA-directed RNA polymerase subunit alpha [Phycisphaerales bacterium]|nr:MAG: DNA-directed RNA polymerase subunit alpha [Phycisphaerales bacterium]
MRIRWQGFELPSRFVRDEEVSTDRYGRFVVEPFERGFGTTIGNSLRRVLLSSLEGAAPVSVRIQGASHEFMSLDGVKEDVSEIILNVKSLVIAGDIGSQTKVLRVVRDKAGDVRGKHLQGDAALTVVNGDQLLCTLTADVKFDMEIAVRMGRGYATVEDNQPGEQEVGVIPIDSIFSPVLRVRYRTEDTRVGQRTNYDRLILEVWTRGTVTPDVAIVEASKILRKHLNPFVYYHELGEMMTTLPASASLPPESRPVSAAPLDSAALSMPVSALGLSARAQNCLDAVKITTVGELASKTEAELLRFRSFGKTSLNEVKRKLGEMGLGLAGGPPALDDGSLDEDLDDEDDDEDVPGGPMEVFTMGDGD